MLVSRYRLCGSSPTAFIRFSVFRTSTLGKHGTPIPHAEKELLDSLMAHPVPRLPAHIIVQ